MKIGTGVVSFTLAVAVLPGAGRDRDDNPKAPCPAITLKVWNEAQLDDQILLGTKKETTEMLGRTGVRLVWVDCAAGIVDSTSLNPCRRDGRSVDFRLHITTYKPPFATREMLGYSDPGGTAAVYYPAVAKLSKSYRVAAPQILSAAIIHEVGHLILGANAHTPQGVMRAHWGLEQFRLIEAGELDFARDQAKLLRAEVKRRLSEQP
jgi:hypothetical protein